jgi:enoyl-CoA hydratase/carnithine racemase
MGEEMAQEFRSVVAKLALRKRELGAIILTGSGKAFSAGGDLAMLDAKRALSTEENRIRMREFYEAFLGIRDLEVPLIAAIQGPAIGAGMCLATACDLRVASETATLGFTFVRLGLHPGMGATYFLPRVVGVAAAGELLLTGRVISAAEAYRLGLVSEVTKPDETLPAAERLAQEIMRGGPECIRQLLGSLRAGPTSLEESLEREARTQAMNYGSKEFAAGLSAVREKRAVQFRS